MDTISAYDIILIGAGPAGTACALALENSGLRVALLDQSKFPRDKVCGDAIPGKALKVLKRINPYFVEQFKEFSPKAKIHSTRIALPNGRSIKHQWVFGGYNSKRLNFDAFHFGLVQSSAKTELLLGKKIKKIGERDDFVYLQTEHETYRSKLVVGCDGANSIVAKKLAGFTLNRKHNLGAVRRYYKNIENSTEGENEVFFSKKYMPGYFWIFPVGEDIYNVGFGMLSATISKRKINLTKALDEVIEE